MTHLEDMISATSSWAAAYLLYKSGRNREGYAAYAFVEDDDDRHFYQHVLAEFDDICFVGCGGKSGVIAVFQKLDSEDQADGNLFYVDRDTDQEPFLYGDQIHRTDLYSWESYVCKPDNVAWLLQRKFNPNLSPARKSLLRSGWSSTLDEFRHILAKHTALLKAGNTLGKSLGMNAVSICEDASFDGERLVPGPNADEWFEGKVQTAVGLGMSAEELSCNRAAYQTGEPIIFAQGKVLFDLLRRFVREFALSVDLPAPPNANSPKLMVLSLPWNLNCFESIRAYALGRLVGAS